MTITVKLFASYRELIGQDELVMELVKGATVGDALDRLGDAHPVLAHQGYSPLIACNLKHAGKHQVLEDGDELAVFPPVSGG